MRESGSPPSSETHEVPSYLATFLEGLIPGVRLLGGDADEELDREELDELGSATEEDELSGPGLSSENTIAFI